MHGWYAKNGRVIFFHCESLLCMFIYVYVHIFIGHHINEHRFAYLYRTVMSSNSNKLSWIVSGVVAAGVSLAVGYHIYRKLYPKNKCKVYHYTHTRNHLIMK